MRPDKQLIEVEAREEVKRALACYPHPQHVLLYAAHALLQHPQADNGWNALQKRSDLPSDKLADALIDVDEHLNRRVEEYMHG